MINLGGIDSYNQIQQLYQDILKSDEPTRASFDLDHDGSNELWELMQSVNDYRRTQIFDKQIIQNLKSVETLDLPQISQDNPIRLAMAIEENNSSLDAIQKTLQEINAIIADAKKENDPSLSPQEKLALVYDVIHHHFNVTGGISDLLSEGLSKTPGKQTIDCDTGALIFAAVAHEMHWPITPISVNENTHMFLSWQDENHSFYYETTNNSITDLPFYKKTFPGSSFTALDTPEKLTGYAYLNSAIEAYEEGNYSLAEKACADLKKTFPGWATPWYIEASICFNQKKFPEAITLYSTCIEKSPYRWDAYLNRGLAYALIKDYEKARADLQKVLSFAIPDQTRVFVETALKKIP